MPLSKHCSYVPEVITASPEDITLAKGIFAPDKLTGINGFLSPIFSGLPITYILPPRLMSAFRILCDKSIFFILSRAYPFAIPPRSTASEACVNFALTVFSSSISPS